MKKLGILLCVSLIFASCVSMQDDIYIDSVSNVTEVSSFENRFSSLDAQFIASQDIIKDKTFKQSAQKLIADIQTALNDVTIKKAVAARLYAIAGCMAFDSGEKSQAKKFYELSVNSFKGDARSLILAHRLEIEKNLSEKTKLFSDKSLLILESALTHYSNLEYAQAVAQFDEAFLSLDSFYRSAYGSLRDKSWNLRNLGENNSALLALPKLTVMEMILIADLNPDLLFNYTVGKNISNKELYSKIAGSGLLNPASKPLDEQNSVSKDTPVTKLIAARFLWNLYNQRRNTPSDLTKYSAAYANKKRSPIIDVKLDSPDFDAALGCVENEIMHLDDGIELGAEREFSAVEFNECVTKIK
ncbi:hypothetical protein [Treponema sp.]|uniref:hypothetical protein n=1 Tax=Treponema sp. TaxID=166 RepID=UPI00388FF78F